MLIRRRSRRAEERRPYRLERADWLTRSLRQIPAVHGEDRARHERGLVGGEEEDGVRHLVRFAEPPYRMSLPHRGYVLLGQFNDGLGRYRARRYGVDADAPCGPLDGEVLGDPRGNELGWSVGGLLGLSGETRDRGQADYGTSRLLLLYHGLDGELAGEEHSPSVHGHHTVPVLRRRLHDGIERNDAGVSHEHVYAPEAIDGRTYHASRVLHDRDVPDDSVDLRARPGQPLPQPRAIGLVHIGDDEARLLPGEELGGRLADTLCGPSDYGSIPAQPAESPCCGLRHATSSVEPAAGTTFPGAFGSNCPFPPQPSIVGCGPSNPRATRR